MENSSQEAALSPVPWAGTGTCQALDKYLLSEWTGSGRSLPDGVLLVQRSEVTGEGGQVSRGLTCGGGGPCSPERAGL